ncbi:hypothetical protein EDC14_1001323 [Hydrogenispora ethanolica]|uniref:Uncharacterized protein n=1 Tax=Hydrogenispora ethanolica TaxID=1082276 RepID=A0A4R1SC05_HYDET|nr:hypothetical protein EDC14_1001323 [Hydrogenispora ethanolica]
MIVIKAALRSTLDLEVTQRYRMKIRIRMRIRRSASRRKDRIQEIMRGIIFSLTIRSGWECNHCNGAVSARPA